MAPTRIFQLQVILGYVSWLLCFATYIWPRLTALEASDAQRAIATLHSFRFLGLANTRSDRRRAQRSMSNSRVG